MRCRDMAFFGEGQHQPELFTNVRGTASSPWLFETSCKSSGLRVVAFLLHSLKGYPEKVREDQACTP